MKDDRDYKLELSNEAGLTPPPVQSPAPPTAGRPFISVHFACCNVYLRIYRSADGTAYHGQCPRCARAVNFAVGQGGTDARFFRVE
jgi:hypothetical protein